MATNTQNPAAPKFTAAFCHKIEGKNRITIPAAWRFDEAVDLYMIDRSTQKCVAVMPLAEVERLRAKADEMEPVERSEFLDTFASSLRPVTLDKTGRVSIPEEFFSLLGLPEGREVWLSGSLDTFNIWSVKNFQQFQEAEKTRKETLKRKLGI